MFAGGKTQNAKMCMRAAMTAGRLLQAVFVTVYALREWTLWWQNRNRAAKGPEKQG